MASPRPRPQVMRLTDAAATRIKDILGKAEQPIAGVRVGVKNGGRAGLAYTMEYCQSARPPVGGIMFALAHDGLIYLKADRDMAAAFEREGQTPFTYSAKNGKRAVMSYWRVPDRLYDDPDELAQWARRSLAAAQRAGRPTAKRKR